MLLVERFARDNMNDYLSEDQELFVSCAGWYALRTRRQYEKLRPQGRKDHQLLYVASGSMWVEKHGERLTLQSGQGILYAPDEPQHYGYALDAGPEICWVHFCGSSVQTLLDSLHLNTAAPLRSDHPQDCAALLRRIIDELQLRKPGFEIMCAAYFRQLLVSFSRTGDAASPSAPYNALNEELLHILHRQYAQQFSIRDYAQQHGVSECWLIRCFCRQTGMSPYQYLLQLRMDRAQELLCNTDETVQSVANQVGYDNPFYFSRLFKKKTGLAPGDFRKQYHAGTLDSHRRPSEGETPHALDCSSRRPRGTP